MANNLNNKVVLITGASAGIGAGIAVHLASFGCRLALTARNEVALQCVRVKCIQQGQTFENILLLSGDLTKDEDLKRIVTETVQYFGCIDILVNSAGILLFGTIETQTMETYDKVFNVNLRSVVQITQLAIPHLIATKGNVVMISGTSGHRGNPRILALSMVKAALNMFTEVTALDLAPKGVRVNSVNPGVVDTELHLRGGMSKEDRDEYFKRCAEVTHPLGISLGRVATVEDVAKAVAYLASDHAQFVTGVHLTVDGGRTLASPV